MNHKIQLYRIRSDCFSVYYGDMNIGTIDVHTNPFHSQNAYLKLHLPEMPTTWAEPIFSQLQVVLQKPLQVMESSEMTARASFLTAGGFVCKRRCYELELSPADWVSPENPLPINTAAKGTEEYEAWARFVYVHYRTTHAAVSPLTASYSDFCTMLPDTVWYWDQHCAFVEGNEIAYIASEDVANLAPFAQSLAAALFADWGTLCMECDDCDPAAMAFRALFCLCGEASFDTYIRP